MMKKVFIFAFAGFLAFIASGCVGGRPASDSGLIRVCWQRNGQSNFDPSTCTSPINFHWEAEDMPLIAHVAAEDDVVRDVINQINHEVGCTVIDLRVGSESVYDSNITIILDEPFTVGVDSGFAYTTFRRDAMGRVHAYVTTFALGQSSTMRYQALMHELGHVLGLAHDSWEGSIMRPTQTGEMEIIGFTDADVALLGGLYCAN